MDNKRNYLDVLKRAGLAVVVVAMLLVFNKVTNYSFLSQRNFTVLLKQASVLMILSSSLMILLIQTKFDLSGGAGVYLVGVITALLIIKLGVNMYLAIAIGMISGILMGMFNGYFIGKLGLPAFIVTLAAQQMFRGVGYSLTNAATIGPMPKAFTQISEAYVPPLYSALLMGVIFALYTFFQIRKSVKFGKWYGEKGKLITKLLVVGGVCALGIWIFGGYKGIPMSVLIAGVVAAAVHFLTTHTVFGRHVYLIGGNIEAARLAGINTEKRIFQAYLLEGVMYGIAGIVLTARLGGAAATGGNLLELDAVAAACIGGTSMNGGVGSILGVVGGVIILTAIDNFMSLMNVSSYLQMVIKGVILLVAICIDLYSNNAKYKFKLIKTKG